MAIPFLRPEEIHAKADAFLRQYHPAGTLPIPIEDIVELQLKLDIVPTPGLQRQFQVDGFLTSDFSAIYVDDQVQSSRPTRYRFTLAHESGHLYLHRSHLQTLAGFTTVSGWRGVIGGMAKRDRDFMEFQGYAFAGCVLVPKHHLEREVNDCLPEVQPLLSQARTAGIGRADYLTYALSTVASRIASRFDVSAEVVERRIKADGLERQIP